MQKSKKTLSLLITALLTLSMIVAAVPLASAQTFSISKIESQDPQTFVWTDITTNPAASVGTKIRITVIDATPGGLVKVYWDQIKDWDGKAGYVAEDYAVGTTAVITFTVPQAVNGVHKIIARDVENPSKSAYADFTVNAFLMAMPFSVLPGDTISVFGSGFAGSKDVNILLYGALIEDPVNNETVSGSWGSQLGSGVLSKKPIKPNSVMMNVTNSTGSTVGYLGFVDDGKGALKLNYTDGNTTAVSGSGTIDYVTGAVALSWNWALPGTLFVNATYTFYNATKALASVATVSSELGGFSESLQVPTTASTGMLTVLAIDGKGNTATWSVTVVKSTLTLTPSSGLRGSTVTVKGRGFAAGETVDVLWYMNPSQTPPMAAPTGTNYVTVVNDAPVATDGTFTVTFTVPTVADPTAPGTYYQVLATDTASTPNSAWANFMVVETAKITLSPKLGYVDTTVGVTGTWFTSNSKITITFDTTTMSTTPSSVYTASDGSFYATFKVPNVAVGAYNVTATDARGVTATALFTLTAPVVEIRTRATTYVQGDQISIYVKSTESITGYKLVITDPSKITFWQYTIQASDVVTDPITGFNYLSWTILPPKLTDDATLGSWNFTAYDTASKVAATNLFTVVEKPTLASVQAQINALSDKITSLEGKVSALDLSAINNQLNAIRSEVSGISGAASSAASAANSAKSAADSAKASADAAKAAADAAKASADNAVSAVSGATSAAQSAASAANAAKSSADSAASAIDDATTAAEAAKAAAEGVSMAVWVAVVLSLVAAIAAIFAVITIRGKIAG
ncbi:MAG: hypothetical protein NWF09_02730 [Candidatus Bathyarchaeota archaeon]|nr:hypothetical protein [Candidatus Bathyarchaeota archaeon]